ncbi:hypothetical protein ACRALDRAFT_1064698 [Sodiomyces alcalophilus JCM 7366]|uniref:uncharacterized protein n=1 Tax=Sodiomyces alcalophilus JCM 7366 TaxID=591952 RepID=UPI0039B559B9
MLHELAHIVHGPHDDKFRALWNQLRDEHEGLVLKGYTGEGFLSAGRRLGGSARIPMQEARRLARAAAEERSRRQKAAWAAGSGRRLGGAAPRPGQDMRRTIAAAAGRRKTTLQGCGTADGRLGQGDIRRIEAEAARNGFRTKAEEDRANEAAIAQALWELVQEEERERYGNYYVHPSAERPEGSGGGAVVPGPSSAGSVQPQPQPEQRGWTCGMCTLHNPPTFLCCDACGAEKGSTGRGAEETLWTRNTRTRRDASPSTAAVAAAARPAKEPALWQCSFCGRCMERQWWTCSACGLMKDNSR